MFKTNMVCRCAWLLVLICGVGPAASGEGEKAQANFEIHEWGVLVGSYTDDAYLCASRPPEEVIHLSDFREPIIYVHSKDKKPFSLRVTFASGKPALTYPMAEVSGNAVSWPLVQFARPVVPSGRPVMQSYDVPLQKFTVNCSGMTPRYIAAPATVTEEFAPLSELMPALNDVDADELIYRGQTTRFLFYEGEIHYHNTIMLDHTMGEKTATVHNTGSDTVYDVMVVVPPEEGDALPRTVSIGRVQELKAGEKLSLSLVPLGNDVSLASSLVALGFTEKEAFSFERVWSGPFLRPEDPSPSINLIYRLGQEQCRTITELAFDPKPDKVVRAVYLLVRSTSAKPPLQLAVDAGDAERVEALLRSGTSADAEVAYAPMLSIRDYRASRVLEVRGSILHWAAAQKNLGLVKFLLWQGAKVNRTDGEGATPLHRAALVGNQEIAKLLLSHQAEVDAGVGGLGTPLQWTACGDQWEMAKLLLAHGAVPSAADGAGNTPLHEAAFYDGKDVAELLLARGVEVDLRNRRGDTPLLVAASRGSIKVAALLLAHGASVNASGPDDDYAPSWVASPYPTVTEHSIYTARLPLAHAARVAPLFGETPLHRAVEHRNIDMAKLLLAHGADVNAQDSAGRTPLSLAVECRYAAMIELLLAHEDDLNMQLRDGTTLLHQAVLRSDLAMIRLLLDHKADVNAKNKNGQTPLDCAQNPQVAGLLLDHGAKLGGKTSGDFTPLLWAFDGRNNALAARLLACGANPNATFEHGWTLLLSAIQKGDNGLATLLIASGADVNEKDPSGETPLLEASYRGNMEVVKLLLDHGAEVKAKDRDGETPLLYVMQANRNNHIAVKGFLDHSAEVKARDKDSEGSLRGALQALRNSQAIIERLLNLGADAKAKSKHDGPPLFDACEQGDREIVECLLAHGVDVNEGYAPGWTPLWRVNLQEHADIAKLLLRHGADVNTPCPQYGNRTYLQNIASYSGDKELLALVLAAGANVNAKSPDGLPPLCNAVDEGRTEIVAALLAHGADPNPRYKHGETPLFHAVGGQYPEIIKLLLDHHADMDAEDFHHDTPFGLALSLHNGAAIALMLKHGAKPDAIDRSFTNGTALFWAVVNGDRDTAALFLSYGADPNRKDQGGSPLLDYAAGKEMVKLLLLYGADPQQAKGRGRNVLEFWPELAGLVKKRETKPASP
jgi:ankyrin repeat protein